MPNMAADELWRLTASQARECILANQFTMDEHVKSLLSRIKSREFIKAWEYLNPDQVISRARELDALPSEKRGPLHGVVIGVKDVILTKGTRHTLLQSAVAYLQ